MDCKHCHKSHNFFLEIRYKSSDNPKIILFGGKQSENSVKPYYCEVVMTCPDVKKLFSETISIKPEKNEQITGVTASDFLSFKNIEEKPENKEAMEFVKSSLDIARDFCKTMLKISLGAIPLFFAVLKYIGSESTNNMSATLIGLIPVSFFLISAVFYVIGLRPQVFTFNNSIEEFNTFYNNRHISMNKYIKFGTALFILGVGISIFIFIKIQID